MPLPDVELEALHIERDGSVERADAYPTDAEDAAMTMCLELAEEALQEGNPPIGAVLIDNERGLRWGARTIDHTEPRLLGHAEVRAYDLAHKVVEDDLSNCSLVTTAQPCNTCTTPYAEGNIGRLVYAVPRPVVFEVCGIMRPRRINMLDLLADGDTDTTVIAGYRAVEAAALFGLFAQLRGEQATARA